MKKTILLSIILFVISINIFAQAPPKNGYTFTTNDLIITDKFDVVQSVEGEITFKLNDIKNTFESNFKDYKGKISEVTITNNQLGLVIIFVWEYELNKKMLVNITTHHSDNTITLVTKNVLGNEKFCLISTGKIIVNN